MNDNLGNELLPSSANAKISAKSLAVQSNSFLLWVSVGVQLQL